MGFANYLVSSFSPVAMLNMCHSSHFWQSSFCQSLMENGIELLLKMTNIVADIEHPFILVILISEKLAYLMLEWHLI